MGWVGFAASLPSCCPDEWHAAVAHPFVLAAGDGSLQPSRFHRWIQQDRLFVIGLRAVVRRLLATAPATDHGGLVAGLAALDPELELFTTYAEREGIELHVPPMPECVSYLAFLDDVASEGYVEGLTAYYGCERAYLEAWTTVRERSRVGGPYGEWIGNWTSEPFRAYVDWLGERLDAIAIGLPDERLDGLRTTFAKTVRHEVEFWTAAIEPADRRPYAG